MALDRRSRLSLFYRKGSPNSYVTTAADQLIVGLLIEKSSVVIESIKNAVTLLISIAPNALSKKLHHVNGKLQEDLASSLALYFVKSGLTEVSPTAFNDLQHFGLWERAASLIGQHHSDVRRFVEGEGTFASRFDRYIEENKADALETSVLFEIHERVRSAADA